jgi:DNA replication protein DnaC
MIPRRLADYRLDTSPQPIIAAELSRWVASSPWHRGENLLLYGGIGTGKTGLAIGALRAAHEAGVSTELIILSDWLIKQRPSGAGLVEEDQMEIASQPSLLVIDDIGTQKDSQFTYERIYVLINRRYLAMKATIVTTNHSDRSVLSTSLGERATSRLLEQCLPIEVEGPDFREARSGSR